MTPMQLTTRAEFFATVSYTGYLPLCPGSIAAIPGLFFYILLLLLVPSNLGILMLLSMFFFLCWIFNNYWHAAAQQRWKSADPSQFVLDELGGVLLTYILLHAAGIASVYSAYLGFIAFRLCDIIKLPGAKWIDTHLHTANGVYLDDCVSALYAAIIIFLLV